MILVTGGTGVVGSRVVQALLAAQQPVRVVARGSSDWRASMMPEFRRQGIDVVTADVRDQNALAAAAKGCQAIINCAGVMKNTAQYTVESVNVEALVHLVALAEVNRVQRFIHLSCVGATRHSSCRYFRSKWQGENIVKGGNFHWTIVRPSLLFGTSCQAMEILDFWVERGPFIPVIGSGLNHISMVSADEVSAFIMSSLYDRETSQKTYELVGPKSYNLEELLKMACLGQGRRKPCIRIPAALGLWLVRIMARLNPRTPLDEDVVRIMMSELTGDPAQAAGNLITGKVPFESCFKLLTDTGAEPPPQAG